jgi:hypothetical protein
VEGNIERWLIMRAALTTARIHSSVTSVRCQEAKSTSHVHNFWALHDSHYSTYLHDQNRWTKSFPWLHFQNAFHIFWIFVFDHIWINILILLQKCDCMLQCYFKTTLYAIHAIGHVATIPVEKSSTAVAFFLSTSVFSCQLSLHQHSILLNWYNRPICGCNTKEFISPHIQYKKCWELYIHHRLLFTIQRAMVCLI